MSRVDVLAGAGAVLTGGASRRMGTDKALLAVDGIPMALRVADAMAGAGLDPVTCIGGDANGLAAIGLPSVPDDQPGVGPLGGIRVALSWAAATDPSAVLVVASCDLPWLAAEDIATLFHTLLGAPDAGAAAAPPDPDGRRPLFLALRVSLALPAVEAAWAADDRAVRGLTDRLVVVDAPVDPGRVADVDRPQDLTSRSEPTTIGDDGGHAS